MPWCWCWWPSWPRARAHRPGHDGRLGGGAHAGDAGAGAAGLQRASGGRFSLGLGAGSPPLTEGLHGLRWERPVARLRETLTAVRALLAGDRLPHPAAGARPLRLGTIPDAPVPIAL